MQQVIITIVYHNGDGHTGQIAEILAENLQTERTLVNLLEVDEALSGLEVLHQSQVIIFGCPTYFGDVSADFKHFMELTGKFWYHQLWKDKLAAAYTVSSSRGGDKLNTLVSLALFAAQHSMIWISQGILPRYCNYEQTDGQNRLASYIGLMIQTDNSPELNPLHPGDVLTTELFAKRILDVTYQFNKIKINNYEPNRN